MAAKLSPMDPPPLGGSDARDTGLPAAPVPLRPSARSAAGRRRSTPGAPIPLRSDAERATERTAYDDGLDDVDLPPLVAAPGARTAAGEAADPLGPLLALMSSLHRDHDLATSLDLLARGVCRLTGFVGCGISLVLPSGDHQAASVAGDVEPLLRSLSGRLIPATAWLDVIRVSEPVGEQLLHNRRAGVVFTTLLGRDGRVVGSLAGVLPHRGADVSARDCQLLELLAVHTTLLIDQVRSQGALVQNVVLRERERAAEDLYDLVVQRVYAASLGLDMAQQVGMSDTARTRVNGILDDLDDLANQVRDAIRGARRDPDAPDTGARMERVMLDSARTLGFVPQLSFAGDLDSITAHTVSEVEVVLAKALTAMAVNGTVTSALVALSVTDVTVTLEIDEQGGIVDYDTRAGRLGLADLQRRAGLVRGTCQLSVGAAGGAALRWSVPKV